MSRLDLHIMEFDELEQAMKDFQGNTEEVINDVLHNEAGKLIEEAVKRLMPVSGKTWKGKKPAAKSSNSLEIVGENLSVIVRAKKAYQYLYFPDDGTNTRRHVGNKQFFLKGGESQRDEIVDRCIRRLVNDFES
jgi:hypothetical protein